jgi:hypothetical protein
MIPMQCWSTWTSHQFIDTTAFTISKFRIGVGFSEFFVKLFPMSLLACLGNDAEAL